MATTAELGSEIGRELLADRQAEGAPRSAANEFIGALLKVNPRAKLPAILTKDQVRSWMSREGVTETMLREALATARKTLRIGQPEPSVKLPPKRRRTSGAMTPATAQTPSKAVSSESPDPARIDPTLLDGMVPN